jgi:peptide/nickel transport system substrate-binding protein
MYMLAWGSTQTLDADAALFPILRSGEPYSTVHDAELDKLLDQSRQIVDPVARKKVLEQIQQRVAEQQPLLPLYREDTLYAHSTSLNFKGRVDARIPLFDLRLK